ncbi:phosphocarrier protein HPr (plasmid) [Bacillus thuringiensis serovar morrisoni str. 4AA1]|uniref:phosphocarrier protein HPr n=1 Tax=Bacillus TaxID=1386 RepID=UPI0005CEA251|nr:MULTISPECIES: phosphocarrier protein HPr [Bacillus]AJQ62425.1 phosphocarrier protein HPr [Bacillus thuringiensis serovar morrisoni]MED3098429.1 phosphocarrier protein HPr [Bacillus thuringiensis]MRA99692.1 phosphocarrier protein HPr [Bacillus thuringiensis]OTY29901.1 phosphocarrier protein HPr [Bacillus thuringiensis serovar poloniensis]RNG62659.1 phosphocarrier protein HPr [Bacillus thuringiensis]
MVEKIFTIVEDGGLHARPSTALVNAVSSFKSEVTMEYKDKQVNLKSIMGVMALGVPKGAQIKVIAKGEDEEQVLQSVSQAMQEQSIDV